jgi:tRNA dimethylallyltransferase
MSTQPQQQTLIVIAGPTAVGKTNIAIRLAQQLGTEIISADSRQCYQGMRIGTAQPSKGEQASVPHHFVDCFLPEEALTAADFERFALDKLEQVFSTNSTAIICGGTGLYIKALCDGLDEMPKIDTIINQKILEEYEEKGIAWLQEQIATNDPEFAKQGEIENPSRILRALAFKLSVGKSITHFRTGIKKERPFRVIKIGLQLPKETVYKRINERVELMMQEGLLDEVRKLHPKKQLKNLNTVGYTELFDYLDNRISLEYAVEKIKQHSRNYAKRQMTWFQKDKDFNWLNADDDAIVEKIISFL